MLINEHENLIKLINLKINNKDLRKYMLNKIRVLAYSNDFSGEKESKFDSSVVLNALVVNNLEHVIDNKHIEGLDSTQFLMERIKENENAIDQVKKANITIFDEVDPEKRVY